MPLVEEAPKDLDAELNRFNKREDLVALIATDICFDGRLGEEWLALSPERLAVFSKNGSEFRKRLDLPLAEIKSASVDGLVGGGALVVTLAGRSVEVLRYTNARQKPFGRVAKYLGDTARRNKDLREKGTSDLDLPRIAPDKEDQVRCPRCKLLLPEDSKVCPACMSKGKAVRRMLTYFKGHWNHVALMTGLLFVGLLLQLVGPYLTKPMTDIVLNPVGTPLPQEERLALLGQLVLIGLGTQITGVFLGIWRGRIAAAVGAKLSHELRNAVFRHLQTLSLNFFDKRQTGALQARVLRDTQALETLLRVGVQECISNLLLFVFIGAVLLYTNWKLTLLIFLPAPIVWMLSKIFWARIKNVWRRVWHLQGQLSALVSDSLSGVRVVRAFAKEDREIARFAGCSASLYQAELEAEQFWAAFFPILFLIMGIGPQMVWYIGGRDVVGEVFTLGELFLFIGYLAMFYGPLQWMSRVTDHLGRALASAERVFEILDTAPDIRDAKEVVALPRIEGKVEFKDVVFGYEPHKPVLKEVTFDVQPGEMIGLVGQSGAGKSTTINLICRFYEAQTGQILIDGIDIRKLSQKVLRAQIGVVLQEPFLFSGTLYENIAFAKPEATREEVMAAAKAANAHDFVIQKPDGYDTQVGERGQSLSGGERQRISIARALLHNPRILILDEATASVDTDTEKQIQEALTRLIKGRTTFAIAHRLSTLRNANRLMVLKDGKVVESGTHEELLKQKGEFYRLVNMQQEMSKIFELG